MQRSLCPVSPDAEKGLRFELYYLLVITAFPMSPRLSIDNLFKKGTEYCNEICFSSYIARVYLTPRTKVKVP